MQPGGAGWLSLGWCDRRGLVFCLLQITNRKLKFGLGVGGVVAVGMVIPLVRCFEGEGEKGRGMR